MKRLAICCFALLAASCSSTGIKYRPHSFQTNLFAVSPSAPLLSKIDWEDIKAQLKPPAGYSFYCGIRDTPDHVEVSFKDSDPYHAIVAHFERKDGKWLENKARMEKIPIAIVDAVVSPR